MKKKVKKTAKYNPCHILCHPSTWIAAVLLLALLVVYGVSMYGFRAIGPKTELEAAKLAVIDDVLRDYIERYEVVDSGSYQQMTGYGISDEDNVFYVTFDYIRYDDENHTVKHGIMYFFGQAKTVDIAGPSPIMTTTITLAENISKSTTV